MFLSHVEGESTSAHRGMILAAKKFVTFRDVVFKGQDLCINTAVNHQGDILSRPGGFAFLSHIEQPPLKSYPQKALDEGDELSRGPGFPESIHVLGGEMGSRSASSPPSYPQREKGKPLLSSNIFRTIATKL
ncbi:MAG: hypothetical protein GY924_17280 [Planctomycetaceae bacterium]|nr:hypothetical protein [Planctomycetaceae bacterium]